MSHSLTQEQQAVVASHARLLAVDAFAGSGKTSTLVAYADERPGARILYIAFNKSVATEAKERFPSHVECRTTHSLAYATVGKKFADKLGNAQPYAVAQTLNCTHRRAKQVLETLSSWLCSADQEITADHVNRDDVEREMEVGLLVELANRVWSEMQNPRSPLKMPHDGYLKLWAMSKPRLPFDIILLDEAQDTNPLTLELVMAQKHATIVLVGDRHQGIYGFRKAMNAMEQVEADDRVALTKSFRFGQSIADVATLVLKRFKGEARSIEGRADIQVSWSVDMSKPHCVLSRTNAELFAAGANFIRARRHGAAIHFIGGFDSYLFGKVLDAYYLWADERARIKDPSISRFLSFNKFKEYGADAGDAEVKALVRTVETYRTEVPQIYNALKEAETPIQERAAVTLATAHRAKGLEFDQVYLTDDFIDLPPAPDDDLEEINLLYVGFTRAIRAVRLPASLSAWLEEQGLVAEGGASGECEQRNEELSSASSGSSLEERLYFALRLLEKEHVDLDRALRRGDLSKAQFPRTGAEAQIELATRRDTLQWVLEMIPIPDFGPAS